VQKSLSESDCRTEEDPSYGEEGELSDRPYPRNSKYFATQIKKKIGITNYIILDSQDWSPRRVRKRIKWKSREDMERLLSRTSYGKISNLGLT
jgi:hypothetical protein